MSDDEQKNYWEQPASPPTQPTPPVPVSQPQPQPQPQLAVQRGQTPAQPQPVQQPAQPQSVQPEQPHLVSPAQSDGADTNTGPNVNPNTNPNADPPLDDDPITWTAHEHIDAHRGPLWFVLFFVAVVALVLASVFLLQSWSFSLLIVVMAIAFIIYTRRPSQLLTYAVSPRQGVYVGEQLHPFSEFKAFGILQDGQNNAIVLLPRKRFSPGVTLYFPTEVGEHLVDILRERLPVEAVKLDVVDALVRKLHM